MFWQIIIWWTIANNLNETISFGNSAICRIGCPVYAYQLGRTGDIRWRVLVMGCVFCAIVLAISEYKKKNQ